MSQFNSKKTFNKSKNMSFMEMVESYIEYPKEGQKFNYFVPNLKTEVSDKNKTDSVNNMIKKTSKFLSEKEKADGWKQNYFNSKNSNQYFQTNLHFLPEHLWNGMTPYYQDGILIAYKAKDKNIHFLIHKADTDSVSHQLRSAIKNPNMVDKELVKKLLAVFEEKGIESWLTIRAKKLL